MVFYPGMLQLIFKKLLYKMYKYKGFLVICIFCILCCPECYVVKSVSTGEVFITCIYVFMFLSLVRFVPLILYMLFFDVNKFNLISSINSLYVVLCAVQTGGPGIPEEKKVEAQLQSKVFCLSTDLTF